jgi:hypothetical protein
MEVGNAARAGAAYAANHAYDPTNIRNAGQNATPLSTNVNVASNQCTSCCADPVSGKISSANGATVCPGTGSAPGTYVIIATNMSYTFLLPITGNTGPTTLTGNAIARIK